jgi:hypothetical protein
VGDRIHDRVRVYFRISFVCLTDHFSGHCGGVQTYTHGCRFIVFLLDTQSQLREQTSRGPSFPSTTASTPPPRQTNMDFLKPGVVYGEDLYRLLKYAQEHNFAIPSVNCTSSSTVNAALEAARDAKSPIMIQFSNGGSVFYAGKGMGNAGEKAAVAGAIAGAYHVKALAVHYGVPVIIHSDHCAKKLLPWFDGMLEEDEKHFAQYGVPLFSSHMLDLSEEPLQENIDICKKYLERMAKINLMLEMELGITGGEEDGKQSPHHKHTYTHIPSICTLYFSPSNVVILLPVCFPLDFDSLCLARHDDVVVF